MKGVGSKPLMGVSTMVNSFLPCNNRLRCRTRILGVFHMVRDFVVPGWRRMYACALRVGMGVYGWMCVYKCTCLDTCSAYMYFEMCLRVWLHQCKAHAPANNARGHDQHHHHPRYHVHPHPCFACNTRPPKEASPSLTVQHDRLSYAHRYIQIVHCLTLSLIFFHVYVDLTRQNSTYVYLHLYIDIPVPSLVNVRAQPPPRPDETAANN